MDPASVAGLIIAIVQLTGTCVKSINSFVGPSQHHSQRLKDITSDVWDFQGAVTNLQTFLESSEENQARLDTLPFLQHPLETCKDSLQLIKTRLEDETFVGKYLLGSSFDKKLKDCLRSLKMGRTLFHNVLLLDNRSVFSSGDAGAWLYS